MDSDWAADRIEQIRTLMNRSASYRRALAPTTLTAGTIGLLASGIGWFQKIESPQSFIKFWLSVALFVLISSLFIVRRQSLQSEEAFWSLPTQRIAEGMFPPFLVGLVLSVAILYLESLSPEIVWWLPAFWMTLYGCGLYSAGFFMPRGIKLFGAGFIVTGCVLMIGSLNTSNLGTFPDLQHAHLIMGGSFGFFHMAYGLYLYLTETIEEHQ